MVTPPLNYLFDSVGRYLYVETALYVQQMHFPFSSHGRSMNATAEKGQRAKTDTGMTERNWAVETV